MQLTCKSDADTIVVVAAVVFPLLQQRVVCKTAVAVAVDPTHGAAGAAQHTHTTHAIQQSYDMGGGVALSASPLPAHQEPATGSYSLVLHTHFITRLALLLIRIGPRLLRMDVTGEDEWSDWEDEDIPARSLFEDKLLPSAKARTEVSVCPPHCEI